MVQAQNSEVGATLVTIWRFENYQVVTDIKKKFVFVTRRSYKLEISYGNRSSTSHEMFVSQELRTLWVILWLNKADKICV
jgi:hypothetical protein